MRAPQSTRRSQPHVIFLHIGWARDYVGAADDPPLGKFGYIVEGGGVTGESLNFRPYKGSCYGYAPHFSINLTRLGSVRGADHVDHVLVVWTATEPSNGGRFIVGWYKDARVYAEMGNRRPNQTRPEAIAVAAASGCHRIPEEDRTFFIPSLQKGWPGQASAFYASATLSQSDIDKVLAYVNGESSEGFYSEEAETGEQPARHGRGNRNQDPDIRARVEAAAVKIVTAYYRSRSWAVTSIEGDNKGWDLDVSRSKRLLRVEVKGLSGQGGVELTPGEYKAMQAETTRMSYRLAIVRDALSATPKLTIFAYLPASGTWSSEDGKILRIKEMMSASMSF